MADDVYTLYKKEETDELHLFVGKIVDPDPNRTCTVATKSICRGMSRDEKDGKHVFACKTEEVARKLCAAQGRKVCGTCVSHLYETY